MGDRWDPRRTPLNLDEGWRVDEYDYPPVGQAANANGRSVNDVCTRPAGYVPFQSMNQPDVRHGYNPADRYPRLSNDERDLGRRAETWEDRRFINTTPATMRQPQTVPLEVGPFRAGGHVEHVQRREALLPVRRDHAPARMIDARAHPFLPGSPSPGPLVPMPPPNRERGRIIGDVPEVVRRPATIRAGTPIVPYPVARQGAEPGERRSPGPDQRGDARGFPGGSYRRYGGERR